LRPTLDMVAPCYDRLGYNHAHELRPITRADVDKVKSKAYSEELLQLAKL
jgi:sterol carrier protein 2